MPKHASKKTCELIEEAIKDENTGVIDYGTLSRKLSEDGFKKDAKLVGSIQSDEHKHNIRMKQIKKRVCGK